jgi:hypothetical protein
MRQILERNPRLHFDLQVQHLIELIRDNKVTEALGFARQALAPLGEGNVSHIFQPSDPQSWVGPIAPPRLLVSALVVIGDRAELMRLA